MLSNPAAYNSCEYVPFSRSANPPYLATGGGGPSRASTYQPKDKVEARWWGLKKQQTWAEAEVIAVDFESGTVDVLYEDDRKPVPGVPMEHVRARKPPLCAPHRIELTPLFFPSARLSLLPSSPHPQTVRLPASRLSRTWPTRARAVASSAAHLVVT